MTRAVQIKISRPELRTHIYCYFAHIYTAPFWFFMVKNHLTLHTKSDIY